MKLHHSKHNYAHRIIILFLSGVLFSIGTGCDDGIDTEYSAVSSGPVQRHSIIDGVAETGYENVGYVISRMENKKALCTGTAIDVNWVLTAAHCVFGAEPEDVAFHTGTDKDADPGQAYGALSVYIHPSYKKDEERYDLALVLVDGLTDGPFYDINTTSPAVGTPITWIGYGMNQIEPELSGSGIKRRGEGVITEVALRIVASSSSDGQIPCNGDSGGPAFATIGNALRIVGVASEGNCIDSIKHVRVDGFLRWINLITSGKSWTDCDLTGGDCDDGTCYPIRSGNRYCFPSEEIEVGEECRLSADSWTVGVPCEDGAGCFPMRYRPDKGQCASFCKTDSDCPESSRCEIPAFSSIDALSDVGRCTMDACNILGGDCDEDTACYPEMSGSGDVCRFTEGIQRGHRCDPESVSTDSMLQCADGLYCLKSDGICSAFCRDDDDCGEDEICKIPFFSDRSDVGVCHDACSDADNDDVCEDDDCDDDDSQVHPGASEVCDDGVDNDCDGDIDEEDDECRIDTDGPEETSTDSPEKKTAENSDPAEEAKDNTGCQCSASGRSSAGVEWLRFVTLLLSINL